MNWILYGSMSLNCSSCINSLLFAWLPSCKIVFTNLCWKTINYEIFWIVSWLFCVYDTQNKVKRHSGMSGLQGHMVILHIHYSSNFVWVNTSLVDSHNMYSGRWCTWIWISPLPGPPREWRPCLFPISLAFKIQVLLVLVTALWHKFRGPNAMLSALLQRLL